MAARVHPTRVDEPVRGKDEIIHGNPLWEPINGEESLIKWLGYSTLQDGGKDRVPTDDPYRLVEIWFDPAHLAHYYQVQWRSKKKEKYFRELIMRPTLELYATAPPTQVIRLRCMTTPLKLYNGPYSMKVTFDPGYYNYTSKSQSGPINWYVSFSEQALFGTHDTDNFASDDIMALEHPILGSIREALTDISQSGVFTKPWLSRTSLKSGIIIDQHSQFYMPKDKAKQGLRYSEAMPFTIDLANRPTPFLITNAPRICNIGISVSVDGVAYNIYRNFKYTDYHVLKKSVTPLSAPFHSTNLICMKALDRLENPLRPRKGPYQIHELRNTFLTAFTAFHGVMLNFQGNRPIQLHTGDWGCGEYGNNRVVISFLQLAAARAAGIHSFIYHSENNHEEFFYACQMMESIWPQNQDEIYLETLLTELQRKGLRWVDDTEKSSRRASVFKGE